MTHWGEVQSNYSEYVGSRSMATPHTTYPVAGANAIIDKAFEEAYSATSVIEGCVYRWQLAEVLEAYMEAFERQFPDQQADSQAIKGCFAHIRNRTSAIAKRER